MRVISKASLLTFFGFCFFSLAFEAVVFADFKLQDAIEHFGERRFIRDTPARLKVGPLKVHSKLHTQATYDSNILLENRDAREDVVFTIQPGVILELPVDTHQLAVGYEADMEIFSKSRQSSQTDQNQKFFALADIRFPKWYLNVLEEFSETSGRAGTTFTTRIPRYDQSVNPKVGVHWKRLTFETGFRHFLRDFRRTINNPLDFSERGWTGVVFYDLFARLKALVEYHVGVIEYDNAPTRDSRIHQTRIGLEGELMPNLLVETNVGMQFRDYQAPERPDFNSWIGKVWLRYQMRENLKGTLGVSREPAEATFGDVTHYLEHRLHFGIEYEPVQKWILFAEWEMAHQDYGERSTVDARVGFRRDDLLDGKYGVRWLANEWMQFEMSYEHLRRDSNFSTFDYTDHRFSAGSTLSY